MRWSTYFQNPIFLEMTRKFLIPVGLNKIILDYCGISDGMRVLDVGCGTGYFTRYLAGSNVKISITGIDREEAFIKEAEKLSKENDLDDKITFVKGDALTLPFKDCAFDAVVSHTFLTNVENPDIAMNEMKRVCKYGGSISSITAMSLYPQALCPGFYPPDCRWVEPLAKLSDLVWIMYQDLDPLSNYLNSMETAALPRFFHESGLTGITIYPLGKSFSLSDARIPDREKKEYIIKMYLAKKQKIETFMALEAHKHYITDNEYKEYINLLGAERDFWLENLKDNSIWQWEGGANLLVMGRRQES